MQWTPVWAVIGALIGALGTYRGVVVAQRETLRRELHLSQWKLSADTYVDLIRWTGWVQHWYIAGAPDPHERPLTVEMARIAAKLRAFGDDVAGDKAFQLLTELRPYVSSRDISGAPPPPGEILKLAEELALLASGQLSGPADRGRRTGTRPAALSGTPSRRPESAG